MRGAECGRRREPPFPCLQLLCSLLPLCPPLLPSAPLLSPASLPASPRPDTKTKSLLLFNNKQIHTTITDFLLKPGNPTMVW